MSGDPVTFGDIVDRHQREVLRYLRRLCGDPTDADDLFQDTVLRALSAYDRLRPSSNHRAWLYRIATNVFLNHRRTRHRRREAPLAERPVADRPGGLSRPDTATALEVYRRAIAALPPRQRAAFVQRRMLGWSYAELAAAVGGTEAAARANVYQAARRLRRELAAPRDRDERRRDP